jgi:hypothetical protein
MIVKLESLMSLERRPTHKSLDPSLLLCECSWRRQSTQSGLLWNRLWFQLQTFFSMISNCSNSLWYYINRPALITCYTSACVYHLLIIVPRWRRDPVFIVFRSIYLLRSHAQPTYTYSLLHYHTNLEWPGYGINNEDSCIVRCWIIIRIIIHWPPSRTHNSNHHV